MHDYERHPFIHGWSESIEKKSVLIVLNVCIWGNILFGIFIDRLRATHVLDGGAALILIVGLATNHHARYLGRRFWFNLKRFGWWLADDGAEIGGEILGGLLKFLWSLVWNRMTATLAISAALFALFVPFYPDMAGPALKVAVGCLCGLTGAALVYARLKVRDANEKREERDAAEREARHQRDDHERKLAAAREETNEVRLEMAKLQSVSVDVLTQIQNELSLTEEQMAVVLSALPYLRLAPGITADKLEEVVVRFMRITDERRKLFKSFGEAERLKKAREDASTQ